MKRMPGVNEWHQESPDAVVEEDSSGYDKHSKAKELVKHNWGWMVL